VETETVQLLLVDVSRELVEKAKAAKGDAERSGSDYDKGRHFALYEAVSLIAEQARAFGVDLADIGLEGVDAERDLLGE
jgi:hypothetical protein